MRRLLFLLVLLLVTPSTAEVMPTSGLDGVKVHMSFAHDRGMMAHAVEYKGKQYEMYEAADAIVPQIGWDKPEAREDIAMAWVEQVELSDLTILRRKPDEGDVKFHSPKVVRFDDGSVEVTAWVRHPVGMVPERHFSRRHFHFDDAGKLKRKTLDSVNVPLL